MKKVIAVLAAVILCCTGFTACGNQQQEVDTVSIEIKQNDYRGGVTRTEALQTSILNVMEKMKANNKTIRESSPNSFWTTDGYQDFVVNFLNSSIMKDTEDINEEENEWKDVLSNLSKKESRLTMKNDEGDGFVLKEGVSVTRNEKDDYTINNVPLSFTANNERFDIVGTYRILYDCDKDWCKAYITSSLTPDIPDVTVDMYEYARIDANTFAVQTSKERLLLKFKPTDKDVDLREREISEFYYSKLTNESKRTTFEEYKNIEVFDEYGDYDEETKKYNDLMNSYGFINNKGDICVQYGKNDSMFLTDDIIANVTSDWVFEDKSLQQAIIYKDGALVVTTYNKLSENYERFIYALDGVSDADIKALEEMVEIESLVGVQSISGDDNSAETEEPEDATTELDSAVDSATDSAAGSAGSSGSTYSDSSMPESSYDSSSMPSGGTVSDSSSTASAGTESAPVKTEENSSN